jgi:hypothetical protein
MYRYEYNMMSTTVSTWYRYQVRYGTVRYGRWNDYQSSRKQVKESVGLVTDMTRRFDLLSLEHVGAQVLYFYESIVFSA